MCKKITALLILVVMVGCATTNKPPSDETLPVPAGSMDEAEMMNSTYIYDEIPVGVVEEDEARASMMGGFHGGGGGHGR